MSFITTHSVEIIVSGIILLVTMIVKFLVSFLVRKYAHSSQIMEHRTNLVIKYLNLLLSALAALGLILVWGVQAKDIFIAVSSIATVVGVAMVAQWSILSNITAGIILFFSFPFKIGDIIKIHDKDFPIIGEIEDIKAFHISLLTKDGEVIIYPNNLVFQKGISIVQNEFED